MSGKNYQDLHAWQKSMDLAVEVYRATKAFPKEELYGLTSQIRRAAISIPSNIAEGQGRKMPKEFLQFLRFSLGSLRQVETQLLIAHRVKYVADEQLTAIMGLAAQAGRLIQGLANSLRNQ
jgi:four helix bundle protein